MRALSYFLLTLATGLTLAFLAGVYYPEYVQSFGVKDLQLYRFDMVTFAFLALSFSMLFYFIDLKRKLPKYVHRKTGGKYELICTGKLRTPEGEWIPCVVYRNDDREVFVRELQNFLDSFDYK